MTRFVDDYLLYLMAAASDRASAGFHAHVRKQGLRVPEWRVLACLSDDDGAMITRLADFAMIEQSRLTRIVDGMADKGWVTRAPDEKDKRRVRVWLTPAGQRLAQGLVADAGRHEAALLGALEGSDAARLKVVLRALLTKLDGVEGDALSTGFLSEKTGS